MGVRRRTSRRRAGSRTAAALRDRSLLIVDDDAPFADSLRRWAQKRGARAVVARHGREALDALERAQFDALIVDLRMSEMDGYELHLRLAVERPETLRRTVFVTGDTASSEAADFFERSGCPCLGKPFEFEELERALVTIF